VQVAHALLLLYCFITVLLHTDTFERQRAGKTLKAMEKSLMLYCYRLHALLLLLYCFIPAFLQTPQESGSGLAAAYMRYCCCCTALLHTDTFERQRAGKTLKAMEKSLMSWETDANETLNDWQVALLLLLYCCIPALLLLPGRRTPAREKNLCVCVYI
jgi:hypothetical protein